MEIALIGLNQDSADIQIRNRAAYTDARKIEALNVLLDLGIEEAVILGTCGRNEIYICDRESQIEDSVEKVAAFFETFFGVPDIRRHLYIRVGQEAVRHLMTVACGLDSIVLGEDQILGQVKEAHSLALDVGSSRKVLNRLFRDAVTAAKRIKTELRISEHPVSVSYIGVKFLLEKLGTFEGKRFLIVGTGKMGRLALNYVMESSPGTVYMTNRNHQKVIDLTGEYPEIRMIPYEERYGILPAVDVVITATASAHHVFRAKDMPPLTGPLYMMDLALPQDVEPAVGDLPSVTLFNVDSLMRISEENEARRRVLAAEALQLLEAELQEFGSWMHSVKADPAIVSLNALRLQIEADTFDYLNRKLVMDQRDRRLMEKMVSSALKRMIREPIMKLKSLKDADEIAHYTEALETLFQFRRD